MKLRPTPSTLFALAAAGALLALSGPGVSVARADSTRRIPLEIGGDQASCRAPGSAVPARRLTTQEAMARLQDRLRADIEAEGSEAVVLNGRGYNYGRDERPDLAQELELILRDARRQ